MSFYYYGDENQNDLMNLIDRYSDSDDGAEKKTENSLNSGEMDELQKTNGGGLAVCGAE